MAESPVASAAFAGNSVRQKPRPALRVMDHRHLEERADRALVIEQLFGQEGEVSDVIDDWRGDASPSVANDGSLTELEAEDDGRVNSVVEAADNEQLSGGHAECYRAIGPSALLVASEQRGDPGHLENLRSRYVDTVHHTGRCGHCPLFA